MVSNCDAFYKVIANDSCYDIANNHAVSLANFYAWNLAVKKDCSGLQANEYVCFGVESTTTGITTPYPVQTGMVSTCDKFYKVVADDSCVDIANEYGISTSSFYAGNPAVKTDCTGLQADEYLCVAVA